MIDWTAIEKLIDKSNYNEQKKQDVIDRLVSLGDCSGEFEQAEYWLITEELKQNTLDPITHGGNYNQTDILNHLRKLS
jgi:flagellar motor switch protein FliG